MSARSLSRTVDYRSPTLIDVFSLMEGQLTCRLARNEPEPCAEEVQGADEEVEEDEEDGDAREAAEDVEDAPLDGGGGGGGGNALAQLPGGGKIINEWFARVFLLVSEMTNRSDIHW